jgi:hypothetical protein
MKPTDADDKLRKPQSRAAFAAGLSASKVSLGCTNIYNFTLYTKVLCQCRFVQKIMPQLTYFSLKVMKMNV